MIFSRLRNSTVVAGALLLAASSIAAPLETPTEKANRMRWFKEARFGMFIHWGLYSVPAGNWNGKTDYGEWILESAHIPTSTYDKFRQQFNPVKFNPKLWVKMAKDAGMKYIVITTKHHDGFGLFPSEAGDWNIKNTPYKHDIMKALATECKNASLKICWYHSIMDWHSPLYAPRRQWNDMATGQPNMDEYEKYLHKQVKELLTNYGDIGLMWFDGQWEATWSKDRAERLYNLCRSLQPNVIVNNRCGAEVGDYGTPEQFIPATGIPGSYWETCMTMNDHWGYNKNDLDYKTSTDLIQKLCDIASKGGNFLLNVGPTSEGEFPKLSQDRLKSLAKWMKANSDSIYGTDASPFETLDFGRATQKDNTIYLQVFKWPSNGKLEVPNLGSMPTSARLLSTRKPLKFSTSSDSGLTLEVPNTAPDEAVSVIELKFAEKPVVFVSPEIKASSKQFTGSIQLAFSDAKPGTELHVSVRAINGDTTTQVFTPQEKEASLTLSNSSEVTAQLYAKGKPVTKLVSQKFEKVKPWEPTELSNSEPGLVCKEFKGNWSKLPDFGSLSPTKTSIESIPTVEDGSAEREHFGLRYEGYIDASEDGLYIFSLGSDDGSRLYIDDKLIVDNDGLHSMTIAPGSAPLAKGKHKIVLDYFNGTGGRALELKIARLSPAGAISDEALAPAAVFSHRK